MEYTIELENGSQVKVSASSIDFQDINGWIGEIFTDEDGHESKMVREVK